MAGEEKAKSLVLLIPELLIPSLQDAGFAYILWAWSSLESKLLYLPRNGSAGLFSGALRGSGIASFESLTLSATFHTVLIAAS